MSISSVELLKRVYREKYNHIPKGCVFTPYRICPLGAHIDHQLGKVTGFAIDESIYFVFDKNDNGLIEVASLQFDGTYKWNAESIFKTKQNDWADYLRGVTISLSKRHLKKKMFKKYLVQ